MRGFGQHKGSWGEQNLGSGAAWLSRRSLTCSSLVWIVLEPMQSFRVGGKGWPWGGWWWEGSGGRMGLGEQDPGNGAVHLAGGSLTRSLDWCGLHPNLLSGMCFYKFKRKCYICQNHFPRSDNMVEFC